MCQKMHIGTEKDKKITPVAIQILEKTRQKAEIFGFRGLTVFEVSGDFFSVVKIASCTIAATHVVTLSLRAPPPPKRATCVAS
jgi:hypothetical protein